jgi:NAD-dependent SIR2 family protein deacetylase
MKLESGGEKMSPNATTARQYADQLGLKEERCSSCAGTGEKPDSDANAREGNTSVRPCEDCEGEGVVWYEPPLHLRAGRPHHATLTATQVVTQALEKGLLA